MSNEEYDPASIITFLAKEYKLDTATLSNILNSLSLQNYKLDNALIKNIFKILINYTYKLKKSEMALNEKYENNFDEINKALKEIKEQMKKIIKEEPAPAAEAAPPS
jgi:hypothetical protein